MNKNINDYNIYNKYTDNYDYGYDEKALRLKYFLKQYASVAAMGEIVVSSSKKPIIGTTALDTCTGIVFYDRENKKGIVGHATFSSKIITLDNMIALLEKDSQQIIEFAIVSGYRNLEMKDHSVEESLVNYLKENCPKNIKLIPFNGFNVRVCSNVLAYEFAFDVNTGVDVSDYLFYDGKEYLKRHR